MKPTSTSLFLAAALLLATSSSTLAQQALKPEALIKWRQSAFQVVAWNSGRIKASLDGGYNKDQVLRSANVIAAIANSGLSSLFPAGTDSGKGWHDTTIKARGRHDPCVLPRAVPIVEAMLALVLADHFLRQRGQCG